MKRILATLMALTMLLNLFAVQVFGAEATDPDLVTAFVDHVFDLQHKDQFVDLIAVIRKVDEKEDMLEAYEKAFNGLTSGQQDRLESFGVTLEAMEAFVDYIMVETYDEKKLEEYLGLSPNPNRPADKAAFRASIEARESDFRAALEAAGANIAALDAGFARMDKLFDLLNDAILLNSLGISVPFLVAQTPNGSFTLDRAEAQKIITIANSKLKDGIDHADTVLDGLQDFVDFYNTASPNDRNQLYRYFNRFGFVRLATGGGPGGGAGGGGGGGGGTTPVVDLEDEDIALALPTFLDTFGFDWAKEAIESLFAFGIIKGKSETRFDPSGFVTRAEFASMLSRMLELIPTTEVNEFEDIKPSDWFYDDLRAAAESGIITGYGNNTFKPHQKVTREEMATMISRVLKAREVEEPTDEEIDVLLNDYEDKDLIEAWSKKGSALAAKLGIIQGYDEDGKKNFKAKRFATRAEAVVMLYRMATHIETVVVIEETETEEETATE
ncbi:S-layer homology domain-containing protein [Petrocella sp. FN5]|uniref:S-layer homology domain-containing protein n=1 Tax=Petrocella sp. FN5 TaxID=3032002 RepID=UPI0023DB723C|nr:S-layer homology domain-containing protein [Petrocella sp. FN5]MDF1617518.1 S-layer homology domain-containing protein [Petrocella sp. FN5]